MGQKKTRSELLAAYKPDISMPPCDYFGLVGSALVGVDGIVAIGFVAVGVG